MTAAPGFRLAPPQHLVRLVRREGLLDRLDECLQSRCALLQAPAGYGKTVLLSQWREHLTRQGRTTVWVTVDRDDGSLGLIRWLRIGLTEAGLMTAPPSDPAIQLGQLSDVEEQLATILHSLEELRSELIIILDGYHAVQSPEADALVARFLREMSAKVRVAIASRSRPRFDLATLRAKGQVVEIDQDALRFDDREAADLLDASLADALVQSLNAHVEGWPIALQLANLRVHGADDVVALLRNFSGTVDEMAEYLASHILADLPGELRDFLVETSILDLIDGKAADAVRGRNDSHALLDRLRRMNALLTPADQDRRAFRHHPLIADFLEVRRARLAPSRLVALHQSASKWFEDHGDAVRAVRHAREAGDLARATTLIEKSCSLHLCLTDVPQARSLLSLADPLAVRKSLRLQLTSATLDFKDGNLPAGRCALERAREIARISLERSPSTVLERDLTVMIVLRSIYQDVPVTAEELRCLEEIADHEPDGSWLLGLSFIMRCLIFLRRGDLDVAKTMIFQAIRNLYETDSLYARMFSNFHLGTVAFWQGRLAEAHNAYRTAEHMALEHFAGNASVLALAQVLLAEVAYEQNDVTHATDLLRDNMKVLESSEIWSEIYLSGYRVAAGIALAGQDADEAKAVHEEAMATASVKGLNRLRECALAQRISRLAAIGRLAEADHLLVQDHLLEFRSCDVCSWLEREEIAFAAARLRIAQGRPDDALALLKPILRVAQAQERGRSILQSQILNALACQAAGKVAEALDLLIPVVEWGAVEGMVRIFVDEGPRMADLLRQLADDGTRRASPSAARYAERLLNAFGDLERDREMTRLLKLLTNRENEILVELARGHSNKMIARHLDISEDGIKFHLKNIYRKLGVNTRVMALNVAQKMQLI